MLCLHAAHVTLDASSEDTLPASEDAIAAPENALPVSEDSIPAPADVFSADDALLVPSLSFWSYGGGPALMS